MHGQTHHENLDLNAAAHKVLDVLTPTWFSAAQEADDMLTGLALLAVKDILHLVVSPLHHLCITCSQICRRALFLDQSAVGTLMVATEEMGNRNQRTHCRQELHIGLHGFIDLMPGNNLMLHLRRKNARIKIISRIPWSSEGANALRCAAPTLPQAIKIQGQERVY